MIKSVEIKKSTLGRDIEGPFDNLLAAIDMADMTPAHIHEVAANRSGHSTEYFVCYDNCR